MNSINKKIVAMVSVAVMAIGATGVTAASATKKEGKGWCGEECLNKWEYTDSASSDLWNDSHAHRTSVTVKGKNYYSGTDSSDYNADANEWSYAYHNRKWLQSYSCHYDIQDEEEKVTWQKVSEFH